MGDVREGGDTVMRGDPIFKSKDVMALAGVTFRQLDHWCRTYFDDTPGSGNPRWFTLHEALVIRALRIIGDAGAQHQRLPIDRFEADLFRLPLSDLTGRIYLEATNRIELVVDLTIDPDTEAALAHALLQDRRKAVA